METNKETNMETSKKSNEIDILNLAFTVLKNKKTLSIFVGVAAVIGVIVALSKPKVYKAEVLLAPELSSGGLGLTDNLAEMAANFGVDLSSKSSMDAIYPEIYPDVFASTDFILKLYDVPVRLKKDDRERTYFTHITKEQKMPFWDYPKMWLTEMLKPKEELSSKGGKKDEFKLSKIDNDICDAIKKSILCSIDKKTSMITITVEDQDPLVAAIIADTLQSRLQQYITEYRTKKARADYKYYYELTAKAKEDYEKARQLYSNSYDTNMDIVLESYKSKINDLENDMQLKFNTYSSLNSQLQTARAKVQERTPAFTIIQRPIMPHKASSTPRSVVVFMFIIIGIVFDTIWILYKDKIKKTDNKTE